MNIQRPPSIHPFGTTENSAESGTSLLPTGQKLLAAFFSGLSENDLIKENQLLFQVVEQKEPINSQL
jgi:hypothetical protein